MSMPSRRARSDGFSRLSILMGMTMLISALFLGTRAGHPSARADDYQYHPFWKCETVIFSALNCTRKSDCGGGTTSYCSNGTNGKYCYETSDFEDCCKTGHTHNCGDRLDCVTDMPTVGACGPTAVCKDC